MVKRHADIGLCSPGRLATGLSRLTGLLPAFSMTCVVTCIMAGSLASTLGCASTARGQKQSVYLPSENLQLADGGRSQADANVVIRYPAMVDRDMETDYFDAFAARPIGGTMKESDNQGDPNTDRVAEAIIAKSNYFAMSLYHELQAVLPENSVLLSPHLVYRDAAGQLSSQALLASEEVPAVITG
jgi:hypothetical protein